LPTDQTLAVAQIRRDLGEQSVLFILREEINRWRLLQMLYRNSGWGTERYNPEQFGDTRREWFGKLKELDKQRRLARRRSGARREELRVAREAFWFEKAGTNAV
jgi:hypothetical protein